MVNVYCAKECKAKKDSLKERKALAFALALALSRTSNLKDYSFHGSKAYTLHLTSVHFRLSVLSENFIFFKLVQYLKSYGY